MLEMATLKVPIISIVIGEGSSGGALALGVGNEVWMLENAIYSILSPEGYASILWKDASRAKEAAEVMKLTAKDLYELKVIDKIIKEPKGEIEESFQKVSQNLKKEIVKTIQEMKLLTPEELVEKRYQKFRKIGEFEKIQ
jgi:acetyl-CoA carboxylase carboxyl transferase alpha subunit